MAIRYDLHTHTTYSDGWAWPEMVEAAIEAGLEGIGFADHCPVVDDPFGRRDDYDFVETYPARRAELRAAASEHEIRLLDAAEVNYDPTREDEIAAFLAEAEFEYTIGSVHFADEYYITYPDMADAPRESRQHAVDAYVEWELSLIESELFDVVSHLDLVQRSTQLRGLMTRTHYERLADALVRSKTVPELNAGRLDRRYGLLHPHPDRLDLFAKRDIPFVVGSDAHAPDQLLRRISLLREEIDSLPVRVIDVPPAVMV